MRTITILRAGLGALFATAACAAPALADNPVRWGVNSGPYCTPSCDSAALGGAAVGGFANALLVDVDGNGSNELITTRYGQGFAPAVYVHEPQQGAQAIEAYYPITGGAGLKVVAGDLDRDGDPDLVVGSSSVNPEVLLNNGNGTFAARTTVTAAQGIAAIAVADINGDGASDLVYSRSVNSTLALSYSPGRGDGTFDTEVSITTAATAKFTAMKLADLDGDGDLDIAGVRASVAADDYTVPRVVVYRNAGDGSFPTFTIYNGIAGTSPGSAATATTSRALATGDYDGDGDLDLAFTGGTIGVGGFVSVLQNAGDGTFGGRTDYPLTGLISVYGLLAGDLDGDGDQDIITVGNVTASSFGGAVGHLLGQGNGTFAAHALPTGASWYSVNTNVLADSGDYTGDGALDLAIPGASGYVTLTTGVKNPVAQTGLGQALISELRLAGPGGYGDQYVDVYNRSLTTPLNLGGWRLKASSGASVRIEQGTMVPAGGHLLLTGPRRAALGWSLDDAGKSALQLPFGNAAANASNGGVALIGPSGATVDAVGFGSVAAGYKEGTALTPVTALGELAFVRRFADGAPVDTGDNAADFVAVDTAADGSTSAQLGAPRPDHTTAPTVKNDFLQSTLLDPAKTASQSPNRVVGGGQLTVNRRIVNCSGSAKTDPATAAACVNAATTSGKTVTKLRFRITDLTTVGTPGAGKAVLKAVASSDATTDGISIRGLPLDAPSASTGGGINSTLTATSLLPAGGLAPGQSINVAFTFAVVTAGKFVFAYNTEDDLIETRDAPIVTPAADPTPTPQPEAPATAEPAAPVADVAQGNVPQSAVVAASAAATPKPAIKVTTAAKAKSAAKVRAKQRAKCRALRTKQRRAACLAKVKAATRR